MILFRLADESLNAKEYWLSYVLDHYPDQLDQFIVISERGIRIRRAA